MQSGEGERGGPAARVADEMKTVEAVNICLSDNPLHLDAEVELRRRPFPGVHLQILRSRVDTLAENLKQRRVCGLCRQYPAWQQHDAIASRHARDPTPRNHRTQRSLPMPTFGTGGLAGAVSATS